MSEHTINSGVLVPVLLFEDCAFARNAQHGVLVIMGNFLTGKKFRWWITHCLATHHHNPCCHTYTTCAKTTVYDGYLYSLGPFTRTGTTIQKVNSNWLNRYLQSQGTCNWWVLALYIVHVYFRVYGILCSGKIFRCTLLGKCHQRLHKKFSHFLFLRQSPA